MAEHWHLTLQSGEVKGNNPYQLNRMTVDSSFRAPTASYDLANIQGYSATGDVILKGNQLSLAPPKTSYLAKINGPVAPANGGCNVATVAQQGGARRHHRHHHHGQKRQGYQPQPHDWDLSTFDVGHAHPDFVPTAVMTTVQERINNGTTDWQQAFNIGLTQSHMKQLNDLTEARYRAIRSESRSEK